MKTPLEFGYILTLCFLVPGVAVGLRLLASDWDHSRRIRLMIVLGVIGVACYAITKAAIIYGGY